jgi:predicted nuclease of predicted toxin-antitoxin system
VTLRFLIDNSLSPQIAEALRENGYDAVHVREYGMASAIDEAIMARALEEGRVVGAPRPSVVLFRGEDNRRPGRQIVVLLANLETISESLEEGSVVVFEHRAIRIRRLPIHRSEG